MNNRIVPLILLAMILMGCTPGVDHPPLQGAVRASVIPNKEAARINLELGIAYLQQGQIERAKGKLLFALKQAPNWPPALDAMGLFLASTGDMQGAEKYHLQSLAIAPDEGSVQNNYGAFLCRVGKLKQAEAYFLRAIRDPYYLKTAEAYENAGLCALKVPDIKKAMYYFERALVYDPYRKSVLLELARLNNMLGHDQKVLFYVNRSMTNGEFDRELLVLGVKVAQKLGQTQLAKRYEKHLEGKPDL